MGPIYLKFEFSVIDAIKGSISSSKRYAGIAESVFVKFLVMEFICNGRPISILNCI